MNEDIDEPKQAADDRDPHSSAERAEIAVLRAKLAQAELRTAAARAGMIDLDGVKLVDTAEFGADLAGSYPDAVSVIAKLKVNKPWLFSRASSSSSAIAPRATPVAPKTAMEMSLEEWRVARAELLRRR